MSGLPEQGSAERLHQFVGLGVHQGVEESPVASLPQRHLDVAEGAPHLVDHRLQGVASTLPAQGHLGRAVETQDQDPAPLQGATKLEEEVQRAHVGPLEVVQHQQERTCPGHGLERPDELEEEGRELPLPGLSLRRRAAEDLPLDRSDSELLGQAVGVALRELHVPGFQG